MKPEILKAKDWVHENGCVPTRVVLLKWSEIKFSTHLEVESEDGKRSFAHGHYFDAWHDPENVPKKLREAEKDFADRHLLYFDDIKKKLNGAHYLAYEIVKSIETNNPESKKYSNYKVLADVCKDIEKALMRLDV